MLCVLSTGRTCSQKLVVGVEGGDSEVTGLVAGSEVGSLSEEEIGVKESDSALGDSSEGGAGLMTSLAFQNTAQINRNKVDFYGNALWNSEFG